MCNDSFAKCFFYMIVSNPTYHQIFNELTYLTYKKVIKTALCKPLRMILQVFFPHPHMAMSQQTIPCLYKIPIAQIYSYKYNSCDDYSLVKVNLPTYALLYFLIN